MIYVDHPTPTIRGISKPKSYMQQSYCQTSRQPLVADEVENTSSGLSHDSKVCTWRVNGECPAPCYGWPEVGEAEEVSQM